MTRRGRDSGAAKADGLRSPESARAAANPTTGTVVSYVRYADGTLLRVLTATPNESGRFGRKKWIHVVQVVKE